MYRIYFIERAILGLFPYIISLAFYSLFETRDYSLTVLSISIAQLSLAFLPSSNEALIMKALVFFRSRNHLLIILISELFTLLLVFLFVCILFFFSDVFNAYFDFKFSVFLSAIVFFSLIGTNVLTQFFKFTHDFYLLILRSFILALSLLLFALNVYLNPSSYGVEVGFYFASILIIIWKIIEYIWLYKSNALETEEGNDLKVRYFIYNYFLSALSTIAVLLYFRLPIILSGFIEESQRGGVIFTWSFVNIFSYWISIYISSKTPYLIKRASEKRNNLDGYIEVGKVTIKMYFFTIASMIVLQKINSFMDWTVLNISITSLYLFMGAMVFNMLGSIRYNYIVMKKIIGTSFLVALIGVILCISFFTILNQWLEVDFSVALSMFLSSFYTGFLSTFIHRQFYSFREIQLKIFRFKGSIK